MVYRRQGRKSFTFQAQTPNGWKQLGTLTTDKAVAGRIEGMWAELAESQENWDLLGRVLSGRMRITELYRLYHEQKKNPAAMRRLLTDVNLEPLVDEFLAIYARGVAPDTLAHVRAHIRALIPKDVAFPASLATVDYLTALVYGYEGKRNTLRKVHSDVSIFFAYCTETKGIFTANPMEAVKRPKAQKSPVQFYELDEVERIVGYQETPKLRALFALMYGTSIEVSVALALTRADIDAPRHEVRAAGTKAHNRDRVCRVADWAWPIVWGYAKHRTPATPLWPDWNRWTVSDWHRETVKKLELPKAYPLKNSRHHWAVRAARAGTPIGVIQNQLGHGSPMLTLSLYGRFLPSASDRQKWETAATEYETERRKA
jgi:integrase